MKEKNTEEEFGLGGEIEYRGRSEGEKEENELSIESSLRGAPFPSHALDLIRNRNHQMLTDFCLEGQFKEEMLSQCRW